MFLSISHNQRSNDVVVKTFTTERDVIKFIQFLGNNNEYPNL